MRSILTCYFLVVCWWCCWRRGFGIDSLLGEIAVGKGICDHLDKDQSILAVDVKALADQLNVVLDQSATQAIGPNVRVGIVSYGTANILNYSAHAFALQVAYAQHNHYSARILDDSFDFEGEDMRWGKIKILIDALDPVSGWARNLDYLAWLDADLVFIDFGLRLELVSAAFPKADIFISAEHAGSSTLVNSGCVLVKNSAWARQFLSDWWSHADRGLYSDQEQFDLLYEHRRRAAASAGERAFTDRVAILAPDELNSDPPAMTQQKYNNKVLHLMGEQDAYRQKVFSEGLREMCRAARAGGVFAPAHQLSLTQANLLVWAAEAYAVESATLLQAYESSLPPGDSAARVPQGLRETKELANSVHHFAHALVHLPSASLIPTSVGGDVRSAASAVASGGDPYRRAVNLRKKVYQLLRRNLVAWKSLQKKRVPGSSLSSATPGGFAAIRADWPELLKVTSTAGQHLLSVAADDVVTMREKRHIAGEILAMMQEMLQNSHEGQHDAILLMVADIHQQIGVLDLSESHGALVGVDAGGPSASVSREFTQAALQHFQLALDVTTRISERSGRHLLVAPMILTANALASLDEFSDAFALYEEANRLNAQHLGPDHQSNIALLVDHGISLVHSGNCREAEAVLGRALDLLRMWEVPFEVTEHARAAQYHEKAILQCKF